MTTSNVPQGAGAELRPTIDLTTIMRALAHELAPPLAKFLAEQLRAASSAPTEPVPTTGLTKSQLGRAIGRSVATIDRLDREGAPFAYVGARKTYDLAAYRAFLAARGKRTTAQPRKRPPVEDDVDVTREMRALGMRAVQ
jgi:hypothetical protein